MPVQILIDTNILVYATDPVDDAKRSMATDVLRELSLLALGVLSVQCLSEFFAVVTRKFNPPMSTEEARQYVQSVAAAWPVYDLTPGCVIEAVRAVEEHGLSYWDALIWAVARNNGIHRILTEDFEHGRVIENVRYIDPFRASNVEEVVSQLLGPRN